LAPAALGGDLEVLTTTPTLDAEPAIAVSPFRPCDAVAVWFTSGVGRTGFFASTRDGWATKHIGEFDFDSEYSPADFSVVYDYFTPAFWACYYSIGDGVVYAKSSVVEGDIVFVKDETHDEVLLDEGSGQLHITDKPWITMGRRPGQVAQSNLYVVYTDLDDEQKIYLRRSVDDSCGTPDTNGRCWAARQEVGAKGTGALPMVSPSRPEILYIAYWIHVLADPENEDEWIKIVKSVDTGFSFGTPVQVHDMEDTNDPFGSGAFQPCIPGQATIPKFPSIVAKQWTIVSEKVFVVWAEVDLGSSGCSDTCGEGTTADVDIYVARLSSPTTNTTITMDEGFPKEIPLDPTEGYTCADQFFPWMTIDGDGTLHVVYFDNRQTPDADDPNGEGECVDSTANQRDDDSCAMTYDLYYTFSTNDAVDWSTPERITTVAEGGSTFIQDGGQPYFIGDYIGVSSSLDPEEPAVNAAFNRDLDEDGDPLEQEVYVGKIEAADCSP
jgi:hypothetical protein